MIFVACSPHKAGRIVVRNFMERMRPKDLLPIFYLSVWAIIGKKERPLRIPLISECPAQSRKVPTGRMSMNETLGLIRPGGLPGRRTSIGNLTPASKSVVRIDKRRPVVTNKDHQCVISQSISLQCCQDHTDTLIQSIN